MIADPRGPTPDDQTWAEMVLVGRIARTHGLRGHVIVLPETDFVEERFTGGATLWTRSIRGIEPLTIASVRLQNGRPVVAFEGLSTIDEAQALVGSELRIAEGALRPLPEGRYFHHQLVGCAVETVTGERVGEVTRVEGGAGTSVLAIAGARGEILVPLARDICAEVDVAARRIRIDPPEGLLELNETKRSGRAPRM